MKILKEKLDNILQAYEEQLNKGNFTLAEYLLEEANKVNKELLKNIKARRLGR